MNLRQTPSLLTALLLTTLAALSAAPAAAAPTTHTYTLMPPYTPGKRADISTISLRQNKIPGLLFRGDIPFLPPDRAEKLDLYLPASYATAPRPLPVILLIHGGGWVAGDKRARREKVFGTDFALNGYITLSVEYQKERGKAWPTNLQDCKAALRWLTAHAHELNADPTRIGVIGGSAGGHLALMTAYTQNNPDFEPTTTTGTTSTESADAPTTAPLIRCVVDLYGITNLETRNRPDPTGKGTDHIVNSALFPGQAPGSNPAAWKKASPTTYVTSSTVPTLILHGTKDTTVNREQSQELAALLQQNGVEHHLELIPNAPHSFVPGDGTLPQDYRVMILDFFNKHLKN